MSSYNPPTINHLALGELSRRKLHMVSMLPSDTLRRAVLIHNIVRSTASLPPSPTTPTLITPQSESETSYDYYPPTPSYASEGSEVETQAEMNFREAAATTDAGSDTDMFVFPTDMTSSSSAQEQIWLDSLLDDLEDDGVHVSVVEAEEHDGSESEVEDAYPLLATAATGCTTAPPPALPPVSPRPAIPYRRHQQSAYSEPSSPPASPPELDAHSFSDDDDEDYMDDSDGDDEVVTPTSSTELRSSDGYFFSPLPFHCNFQPIN